MEVDRPPDRAGAGRSDLATDLAMAPLDSEARKRARRVAAGAGVAHGLTLQATRAIESGSRKLHAPPCHHDPVAGHETSGRGVAREPLAPLFRPASLAVIGASRRAGKLGHDAIAACTALGFPGRIVGVNPAAAGETIAGQPVVASIAQAGGPLDLALVAVPAARVLDAVREAADAGVRAAVVAAAGLGELGGEGSLIEEEIAALCEASGMRLLGPNCFGLYVAGRGLDLTSWHRFPPGRIALVTQSGNIAIALSRLAARAGIGFSSCVGLGNQLDVTAADVIAYHADSDDCDAVALYLEGLPAPAGRPLLDAARRLSDSGRALVVLKAGRSKRGSVAASSHTASLAGDDGVWSAALCHAGAMRVGSPEEMVDVLAALTSLPPTAGRVALLTDGGGDSVLGLDALGEEGIPLAALSSATAAELDSLAPPAAPRAPGNNPVTLDTPGGLEDDPRLLARCAEVAGRDPGVDVIVVSGTFGGYHGVREGELETARRLVELRAEGVPVVVHSAFALEEEAPLTTLRDGGVPVYPTVARLARAIRAVQTTASSSEGTGPHEADLVLPVAETADRLRVAGVVVPPFVVVESPAGLDGAAEVVGFPLCLKVDDPAIAHKSEAGAVLLRLGPSEYRDAAASLWQRFPGRRVVVMAMLPAGVELFVGAGHDATFGPFVSVGRGGVTAEVDPDVALALAPLSTETAREAWLSLRTAPLLTGWRAIPPVDLEALSALAAALGEIVSREPGLTIECNPVIAYEKGYGIADMRALVQQ